MPRLPFCARCIVGAAFLVACEIPDVEQESFVRLDAEPFGGFDPDLCGSVDASGAVPGLQVRVRTATGELVCNAHVIARGPEGDSELPAGDSCVHTGQLAPGEPVTLEVLRVGCPPVTVPGVVPGATSCARAPQVTMVSVALAETCTLGDGAADAPVD